MILDTDKAGNVVVRPSGQDGAVVLTTKEGKMIRYEEKGGVISVTEDLDSNEILRPDNEADLSRLKAGGVGLTLRGADTVVHFDPWWNPSVEDQATDRAHRIGQTRVVTSYKLIARGTVEEKILALQQKKRAIIKATLGGEESLADNLTWEEIQGLFE